MRAIRSSTPFTNPGLPSVPKRFAAIAPHLPRQVPWVAESGIETPAQAAEAFVEILKLDPGHVRALRTPREVRNALAYVLLSRRDL